MAVLVMLSLSLCEVATGQPRNIRAELNAHAANDTVKAALYCRLAETYSDVDFDSLMKYADAGLRLSRELGFRRGIARSLRLRGVASEHKNLYDTARAYHHEALRIFQELGDKSGEALTYRSIAASYYRQTNYPRAIEYNTRSVQLSNDEGDYSQVGMAYADIGGIYTDQGANTDALSYYLKALTAFDKVKDLRGTSLCLINIATVYSALGDYKKAGEYLKQAIPINERLDEKEVVFANNVNMGVVYGDMKDYRSALKTFGIAAQMADLIGDKSWINMVSGNIADAYFQMGIYDTAYPLFERVFKLAGELADTNVLVQAESSLGKMDVAGKRYKEGIQRLEEVLGIAQNKKMKQYVFDISGYLTNAYDETKDYKKALDYERMHSAYQDSLKNDKTDKHLQQLQFDYELQKKENEIAMLDNNRKLAQSKAEKQKVVEWSLGAGLVLVLVMAILLYRSAKFEKKNRLEMLRQKEELQKQAARLEELVRFKDKTFSVLSHDLRGPMGTLTTAMMMLDEFILSPEEFAKIKPEINKQLVSLNSLLDNLLNWARVSIEGSISANPELTDLRALAGENVVLLRETAGRKRITLNVEMGEAFAYCDFGQLDIVIRNLISNAIKFTPVGGEVTITSWVSAGRTFLSVKDTGVGMPADKVAKLFTVSADSRTYGTQGEKGTGLGLLLCNDFVRSNNGSIRVESEVNNGSNFIIELPSGKP